MAASRSLAVLPALLALACSSEAAPVRAQWNVVIETDAPIPQLGDRLLVQILDEHRELACPACQRLISAETADKWPISFGAVATGRALAVRARLFRLRDQGPEGEPASAAGIDILGSLPPADAFTTVRVTLSTRCFGRPVDLEANTSCEPSSGEYQPGITFEPSPSDAEPLKPGSSDAAQDVPCSGDVPEDMICVPGGLFLLGSPTAPFISAELSTRPERLVRLSPFALDADEVSVGEVRRLLDEGALFDLPFTPLQDETCNFSSSPAADALPVNCIDFRTAEAICEARGRRLPTEAEWEFAAGNRTLESDFPWGSGLEHACENAVVGRGLDAILDYTECRTASSEQEVLPPGPVAGGLPGDVTTLGVRNMAGNVSEYVSDGFAPYDAECWTEGATPWLVDPRCPPATEDRSVRGSSWSSPASFSFVYLRGAIDGGWTGDIGLRCALSW